MKEKFAIHWFRRDLRVAGNKILLDQIKKYDGRVLCLFCFDETFLKRKDFSKNRFQFFLETLKELQAEIKDLGGELLVINKGPTETFEGILKITKTLKNHHLETLSFNRDYEPFAMKRDLHIKDLVQKAGVLLVTGRDHLLIEPWELEKNNREGYQVFTPFSRKWIEILKTQDFQNRVQDQNETVDYFEKRLKGSKQTEKMFSYTWSKVEGLQSSWTDSLQSFVETNSKDVTIIMPPAGSLQGYQAAKDFLKRIDNYGESRDIPSIEGTSRLSIYLKNGSITVPLLIYLFGLQKGYDKKTKGKEIYLSELIWREFYYHIIYRHPRVENEAFLEKYQNIKWQNDKTYWKAWQGGLTGFPIVDAGMRELKETGWMHNRVRMIVASFLVKDLLIDWTWGERYFMELLLDGDLAPNNGGWQWAASTGCDPQPYFRIFNPWLQSAKFDPKGEYIKTFLPELRDVDAKDLHQPIFDHPNYPSPIVDHAEQKEKALKLYKNI